MPRSRKRIDWPVAAIHLAFYVAFAVAYWFLCLRGAAWWPWYWDYLKG